MHAAVAAPAPSRLRVVGVVELLQHEGFVADIRYDRLGLRNRPAHALCRRGEHQLSSERLEGWRIIINSIMIAIIVVIITIIVAITIISLSSSATAHSNADLTKS